MDRIQFDGAEAPLKALTEVEMEANRAANRERYAASGFVHFGKHLPNSPYESINEGLFVTSASSSYANLAILGTSYSSKQGASKLDYPKVNIAGFDCHLQNIGVDKSGDEWNYIHFPHAPDGTVTYDSATGTTVQHADAATAFASETTTNKVVTERVDLAFIEGFLEEVTQASPFVYPNGCIQSLATTMDGITTVNSTRLTSYFDQFVGQNGSVGKGVDFFAATDAEKSAMLANPKNNLYYTDDGKLVQFRVRIRTVAGAGNGDWDTIDPTTQYIMQFAGNANVTRVIPQGSADVCPSYTALRYFGGSGGDGTYNPNIEQGTFGASATSISEVGECYALVIGTAQRLNQGAYHPSFNPLGTKGHGFISDPAVSADWYHSTVGSEGRAISTANCFIPHRDGGSMTTNVISGAIDGGASRTTRPDDRYYDAIYAGGQGGFRDYRYSAWDTSTAEYREQKLLDVYNGSYRGEEKLVETMVITRTVSSSFISGGRTRLSSTGEDSLLNLPLGSTANESDVVGYVVGDSGTVYRLMYAYNTTGAFIVDIEASVGYVGSDFTIGNDYNYVIQQETDYPASGEFTCTEVIGDPANILLTDALKDGWLGYWNPTIPLVGTSTNYTMSRKMVGTGVNRAYLTNVGDFASWTFIADTNFNPVANSVNTSVGDSTQYGGVVIYNYTANAYQTKPADNREVVGFQGGLSDVFSCSHSASDWSVFAESIIGKVLTGSTGKRISRPRLEQVAISSGGLLLSSSGSFKDTTHHPIELHGESTPAVKLLPYSVEENGQVSINFAFNELVYSTDWGDDSKIHIASQTTTGTDLNGQTRLIGTATLAIPLGWRKNDV